MFVIGSINLVSNGQIVKTQACTNDFSSMLEAINHTIPHPATFIPGKIMRDNLYDESYKIAADFKFLVKSIYVDGNPVSLSETTVTNYDMSGISSTQPDASFKERIRAMVEILPQPIAADYSIIIPLWQDRFRIKWILTHKKVYSILRFISSIGMKFCR